MMKPLRTASPALFALAPFAILLSGCSPAQTSTNEDVIRALEAGELRIAAARLGEVFESGAADDQTQLAKMKLMLELEDGYSAMAAIEALPSSILSDADRRLSSAHALILQGKPDNAAMLYENADPAAFAEQDFRMLLWALRELEAEEEFANGMDAGLEAFPESADLNALAAAQLMDDELVEEALPFADQALATDPAHYQALLLRGQMAIAQEDLETALDLYKRAADVHPDRAIPQANIAGLQLDLGQVEQAGETLKQALRQHPDEPFVQWQQARHALAVKDLETARFALERSRRIYRGNDEFTLFSAQLEDAAGNRRLAIAEYERYLSAVGEDEAVEARLIALKQQGR